VSSSLSTTTAPDSPTRKRQLAAFGLWSVTIVLAGMFLFAGGSKLAGVAAMVELFDAVGVGQWLRYLTGGIEVLSAVAILVPPLSAFGAAALAVTMVGAIATHLFIIGGSPGVPLLLLSGALVVVWARRNQLSRVF
jgi:putative oxidoreductase